MLLDAAADDDDDGRAHDDAHLPLHPLLRLLHLPPGRGLRLLLRPAPFVTRSKGTLLTGGVSGAGEEEEEVVRELCAGALAAQPGFPAKLRLPCLLRFRP